MLAIRIEGDENLRAAREGIAHPGLQRRPLTEIERMGDNVSPGCRRDWPGGIRRAVIDDDGAISGAAQLAHDPADHGGLVIGGANHPQLRVRNLGRWVYRRVHVCLGPPTDINFLRTKMVPSDENSSFNR